MQPIAVLGPDAGSLATRLSDRLDGRVVRIDSVDDIDPGSEDDSGGNGSPGDDSDGADSNAAVTVRFTADGDWAAAGEGADLTALLDRYAPAYDYAVLTGETRLRVPTVLLGDAGDASDADADRDPTTVPGDVIATASSSDAIDVEELLGALESAEPWVTLEELIDRATADPAADRSGAIASFTGRVRAKDAPDDDRTQQLAFEAYEGVAADRMDTIADELEERDGVFRVLMHHRTGVIPDGEDIVFVVVLAGHREEAFRTVADGIDRLKEEVPIFKKETTESEQFWVHER
ncbi:molybdopterin synthase subunit MoaE /molybdopterin guanine dinucleotide biosynthesis accessory protein MobB [Halopenitus malekzadehii]|uniref:Molybdopterin synthase subunit MoaE /molybdopterin guanine dinucleotide biosynthesis accessory protein MobB n=1 Tax=Halopenitus malekzadehii TaxID=1267564 RepID=A0A1H6J882_9EURY|nr:molybdopterin synthase [Halopenitus malekzadehii]SEH58240.1 molybdopterin synthase subunit MoaE /molybdopterin guanine dinucleotide biosynthesis accessory protein MobB [Halopenitus malekzadehii]